MNYVVYKVVKRIDKRILSVIAYPPYMYRLGMFNIPKYGEFFVFKDKTYARKFGLGQFFENVGTANLFSLKYELWECVSTYEPKCLKYGIDYLGENEAKKFWDLARDRPLSPQLIYEHFSEYVLPFKTYTVQDLLLLSKIENLDHSSPLNY